KKLRSLYRTRRQKLVSALEKRFADKVTIKPSSRGVFIYVRFNLPLSDKEIISRAANTGVSLTAARSFYIRKPPSREFILGFGNLTEKEIEEGVRRLARAII